jgi:folate-binding protein YgfZ
MTDTDLLKTAFESAKKARETGLFAELGNDGSASGIADLGAIMVAGNDAATFLHSQLTNEVNALKPGEGNLSARVTRTGNLVQHFSLHRLSPDTPVRFLILMEKSGMPSLRADLEKFAIADDVAFEEVSQDFQFFALQGPEAAAAVEKAFGKPVDDNWQDTAEYSIRESNGAFIVSRSLTGDTGFIVLTPPGGKLDQSAASNLLNLKGAELAQTLEILRIESGIVRVGPDAPEGKLVLPETCLEQQVVSYSKGCYLGQEVIARIRTYGSVPMALRGLVFEECGKDFSVWKAALDNLPEIGADLLLEDGKKVGSIASRTISPVYEAPIAFAYLDRANRTPGTKLKLHGKNGALLLARVALLPFYKASDVKSRVTFLHDRAIRLFADQQDDKAIELLNQALRLDPSFADGYEALGVILGRSGKFHEAIDIFKRLEEVAPSEPMVHTNLSLFYMKLGDKVAAEEEKAKATVKQFSRFGAMRKEEERVAEAAAQAKAEALRRKAMFEEVVQIDAEDPIALFGLGNALSTLSEWTTAEQVLAKAVSVQKDNSAVYVAHGKALEMLNREAEALEVYRAGMAVASRKGDLMPLKEMERRVLLLSPAKTN